MDGKDDSAAAANCAAEEITTERRVRVSFRNNDRAEGRGFVNM